MAMAVIGILMIVAFFVALFVTLARDEGWREALIAFGATGLISAWVFAGAWLVAMGLGQ